MSNGQERGTQAAPQPQAAAGQPQQDVVSIFISHKHKDEKVARGVKTVLERYGGDRLKSFISEEIPAGDDWFATIQKCLVDSSLLLLIFTDQTMNWDWCLYETGLFTDLSTKGGFRRVICLHPPGLAVPNPLRHLKDVPATVPVIIDWLRDLYGTGKLTGHAPISVGFANEEAELDRAAKEIVNLIAREPAGTVDTKHHLGYVFIRVESPESLTPDCIPPEATVESDQTSLLLFDKPRGDWTWGALEAEARRNPDQRWLGELALAIYRASRGNVVDPVQNTFRARRGGRTYRPILHRSDTGADGSMTFKVSFVEDVSWQLKEIPRDLNTLLTAIVMGTRFRYEVLNPSARDMPAPRSDEARRVCEQIRQDIHNIEVEAASRETLDENSLKAVFDNPADKNEVEAIYREWYQIRGNLVSDLENAETDAVAQHINRLIEINNRFMQLGSRRYAEMMAAGAN
ncbi:MAG: toll/interleukin-1 receptor domain-containing protein [Phycisphaerales bacterium]|nr:MAG: toll/interleukin-1 receptor domain-containing protein [Phycisphaerales bacterium]